MVTGVLSARVAHSKGGGKTTRKICGIAHSSLDDVSYSGNWAVWTR